jgi:uncharacterized metal-binding protein YceD (DUF177 family)
MNIERNPDLELSRRLRLDRIPPTGATLEIVADPTERQALAQRFGVLAVPALTADVAVHAERGGTWRVEGRVKATVVQACGITLEPVEQLIDEPFTLRFSSDREEIDRETGELIVGVEAAEPLEGDSLDIGEIVADEFGVAIDPFPRRPEARLDDILPPDPASREASGPFAALAALRRKHDDDPSGGEGGA